MTNNVIATETIKPNESIKIPRSFVQELTSRLVKGGLPSDIDNIVNVAVRSGVTEDDPNWVWILPILLRQIPPESLHIQMQALLEALKQSKSKNNNDYSDEVEELIQSFNTLRTEINKLPRRIQESLKPAIEEAISDSVQPLKKEKIEIDDKKVTDAMRDGFLNLYMATAIGFGAFFSIVSFFIGAKFGFQ